MLSANKCDVDADFTQFFRESQTAHDVTRTYLDRGINSKAHVH